MKSYYPHVANIPTIEQLPARLGQLRKALYDLPTPPNAIQLSLEERTDHTRVEARCYWFNRIDSAHYQGLCELAQSFGFYPAFLEHSPGFFSSVHPPFSLEMTMDVPGLYWAVLSGGNPL